MRTLMVVVVLAAAAAGSAGAMTVGAMRAFYLHPGDNAQIDALDVECQFAGDANPPFLLCSRRSTLSDCTPRGGACGDPSVAITPRYIYVTLKRQNLRTAVYKVLRTP